MWQEQGRLAELSRRLGPVTPGEQKCTQLVTSALRVRPELPLKLIAETRFGKWSGILTRSGADGGAASPAGYFPNPLVGSSPPSRFSGEINLLWKQASLFLAGGALSFSLFGGL